MPIRSTAPISAFSPGLAKKAVTICLYSTNAINAHNTRNTTIRTRKIRGDDSFDSSISIAERGLSAILNPDRFEETVSGLNMAQRRREYRVGGSWRRYALDGIFFTLFLLWN